MKGGDILDFWKGGNLRKGWVDLEKGGGGMTPLTNYADFEDIEFRHPTVIVVPKKNNFTINKKYSCYEERSEVSPFPIRSPIYFCFIQ